MNRLTLMRIQRVENLKGAAIDIATAVFQEMGIDNVEGHLTDWGELIPGVQAGQYDVITAGMAILPDRCENALFAEPEMQYGEGLVVQAGNPQDIHSYADIAENPDVTVALMEGTTQFDFLMRFSMNPKASLQKTTEWKSFGNTGPFYLADKGVRGLR